jgi:hypothetical protein
LELDRLIEATKVNDMLGAKIEEYANAVDKLEIGKSFDEQYKIVQVLKLVLLKRYRSRFHKKNGILLMILFIMDISNRYRNIFENYIRRMYRNETNETAK